MPTYAQLRKEHQRISAEMEKAKAKEMQDAIAKVKAIIDDFGLTAEQLGFEQKRKAAKTKTAPNPPKYRNPATGATWTGRGKPPTWVKDAGPDRSKFLISAQGSAAKPTEATATAPAAKKATKAAAKKTAARKGGASKKGAARKGAASTAGEAGAAS